MNNICTLIKWPGGKSHEVKYIKNLIPKYNRYIEPFFGGGALFFYLKPKSAIINDISADLIDFYNLVKEQNSDLKNLLFDYCILFDDLINYCDTTYNDLLSIYDGIKKSHRDSKSKLMQYVNRIYDNFNVLVVNELVKDNESYKNELYLNALNKMKRTADNEKKKTFSDHDLKENLITSFTSGTYMYFRNVHNDIILNRVDAVSKEYRVANFYFIREYCYGSMFRYNSKGEFNIPYGGMSYNRKDFRAKINCIFNEKIEKLFSKTEIYCKDFEDFFESVELNENDFMFLDPPYDTVFSGYEGKDFTRQDQQRLANALKKTKAKFILIIKDTDFIYSLYKKDFNILCFDKTYSYNVRSRNDRAAKHLIITNMPMKDDKDFTACFKIKI